MDNACFILAIIIILWIRAEYREHKMRQIASKYKLEWMNCVKKHEGIDLFKADPEWDKF